MAKLSNRAKRHKAWLDKQSGESLTFASKLKLGGKAFESFMLHIDGGGELIDYPGGLEFIVAEEDKVLANKISAAEKELIREQRGNLSKGLLDAEPEAKEPKSIWKPDASVKEYVPSGDSITIQPDGTRVVRQQVEPEAPRKLPSGVLAPGVRAVGLGPELVPIVDMTAEQKAKVITAEKEFKEWQGRNPDTTPRGKSRRKATPEVQEAYDLLRYRQAHPERFYDGADLDAWRALYDASREGAVSNYGMTRWNENLDLLRATEDWNRLVNEIARELPEGEASSFLRQHKIDRGHINPKGVKGWAHQRDVDANISWENRAGNRAAYAETTFGDFVDYMERAQAGDKPFMRMGEADKIQALLDNPNLTQDQRARLKSIQAYTSTLPELTSNIPPELRQYLDVPMFDSKGQFVSRGTLGNLGYSPEQMESIRRLGITLMDQNPEFDLDLFMETSDNTWIRGGTANQVGWRKVAEANRTGSKPGSKPVDLSTREKILAMAKKAGKGTAGLAALLAYSGASYSAQPNWSEDDYIDHILMNLEKYDKAIVQPGRDALMSLADKVGAGDMLRGLDATVQQRFSTIPDGMTKTGAEFIYGAAKDIPAEAIGLLSAAVRTPVAPAENMSWLEIQQQNAWNNQDPMLNMVPVFQPANPVKKFGGVVQPMYGDPMLYE